MSNLGFVRFLTEFRNGDLEEALTAHLETIGAALRDYDGKASLSLSLKFERNKHGGIDVSAKADVKTPRKEIRPAMFYLDEDGAFTRRDPQQQDIEDYPGVRRTATLTAIRSAE